MRKLLLCSLFSISLSSYAQYTWQALPNAPKSWRCDDMYFLNAQMGWAIHPYYNYLTPNQFGQVYKTWNGGNTWTLMHDSSKTFYRSVGFADSLHGWIGNVGDSSITPDANPLYYTSDGGKTLTPVNLPNPKPKGICGISIVTDSVIYAYGRFFGPPILAKTTDKGNTWTTYDMSHYASVGLIDGWFWSKDTGFITGQNGQNAVILHTNNGGVTWQTVYQATRNDSDHVWKIFFPSRNVGYGSIEYLGNNQYWGGKYKTYFVKTIDGGKTWTEYPFIPNYDEEGCGFINDTIGWIGGSDIQPNYITYNGGNTWLPDYGFGVPTPPYVFSDTGSAINRFRKINDTLMYASGNTVYKWTGKSTGINEITKQKYLVEVFPNPASTEITFKMSSGENKYLTISDITGREMKTRQILNNQVQINVSAYSAGIYLYEITDNTNKVVDRGKFSVVK